MANAYERLKKRRADLMKQVGEIDAVLNRYADVDRDAQRLISDGTVAEPVTVPEERASETLEVQKATPIPEYESQLRSLLEGLQEPLSRKELLNALTDRGVVVGGANELNTLGTRLHRAEWVANLKGHGYWLRDRDYEPADHVAGEFDVGLVKIRPTDEGEKDAPLLPGYKVVEKNS